MMHINAIDTWKRLKPSKVKGECQGCGNLRKLTRHHAIPIEVLGTQASPIILICRLCHVTLHMTFSNEELSNMDANQQLKYLNRVKDFQQR